MSSIIDIIVALSSSQLISTVRTELDLFTHIYVHNCESAAAEFRVGPVCKV